MGGKHALIEKTAPTITLPNSDGSDYTFTPGQSGRPTALFFYPESGSFGCTKEVCQFRDALSEEGVFRATNVEVIGVSPDPVAKQKAFVEKQKVTYPILSDEKGEARKAYHVGKGLMGLTASSRVTFIIDSDGIVRDVLDSTINYNAHHKFVEKWLKSLDQSSKTTTVDSGTKPASSATEPTHATSTATTTATAPAQAQEPVSVAPPTGLDPAAAVPAMPEPGANVASSQT